MIKKIREYINHIRTDKKYAGLQKWIVSMFIFGCTTMAITSLAMSAMSDLAFSLFSDYGKFVQLFGVLIFGTSPAITMLFLVRPTFTLAGLAFMKLFDPEEYTATMARIKASNQNKA